MKFEVLNSKQKVVMYTTDISCIPNKDVSNAMLNAGYKFKLNGKILSKKAISEFIKGENI